MLLNRTVLVVAMAAVMLTACNRDAAPGSTPVDASAPEATDAPVADNPVTDAPVDAPDEVATAPEAVPFDVSTVPVSDGALGEWPYVAAPDGYALERARTFDLSQVPFWTGQMLQPVEGKVLEARVDAVDDKTYSRFEVLKRFDESLTALGAQKITTSEIPREIIDTQLPKDFGVEFNAGAGGYYGSEEVSTYVLRRPDRVVWYKIHSDGNSGSVLVAESEDVPAATPAAQ